MKNKNCPNCAAPYDSHYNTCPFCGTSYFDMSCINFEELKPIYLKIKMNINGNPVCITQKCIPRLGDIDFHIDTVDISGAMGVVSKSFVSNTLTTNISFEAVQDFNNNNLFEIQM